MRIKIIKRIPLFLAALFLQFVIYSSCLVVNADTAVVSLVDSYQYDRAYQNMPYSLPQTTTANMSDGSKVEVPVTWSPSTVDLSNTGSTTYTGTVEGCSQKVTLQLRVYPAIQSIVSQSATVYENDPYTLPKTVMLQVNNNSWIGNIDVVWSPSTVDTSTVGVYTYEGTIRNNTLKASFTLTVKPGPNPAGTPKPTIVSLANRYPYDYTFQNMPYSLPQTTTANMSDGKTAEVPVTWSPSTVDLSNTGTFTYTGTVAGCSEKVSFQLNVCPPIVSIVSQNASVYEDDAYTLPKTVTAYLGNNTYTGPFNVVWSPSTVNTSVAGVYTFEGTIKNYTGKASLTLTVKPKSTIVSINNIAADLYQNEAYSLPKTVSALMSDGNYKNVPVTWNSASADTSKTGTFTYSGTVQGYNSQVCLTLVIRPAIVSIQNINAVINHNEAYSLPQSLTALMSDGTHKDVAVNWDTSSVDTAKVGTYTFKGTVQGYSSQVTLTLVVSPVITSIENISVSINHHDSYSLPQSIPALMSDGTNKNVSVSWDPSTADTSKTGTFNYSGTVQGYAGKVTLTLTVNSVITSINNINATAVLNSSYSLPQTVSALMSDGSKKEFPVTWDSTNVDTSKVGTSTFTGTVQGYSDKVTLNLSIVEKSNIVSIEYLPGDVVFQNIPYSLPQTTKATLSDGSIIDVPISWSPATADLSKTGSFNYVGSIEGWKNKINFSLYVYEPVSSLYEMSKSVYQNDSYTLPQFVPAIFSSGNGAVYVEVDWTPSTADTSKIGVFTYEGTVKNYPDKAKLTLTVKPRISFNDIITSVDQNQPFSLPKTVTGYIVGGTTKEMSVTWNSSIVDTSVCGLQTFEGKVEAYEGYEGKINLSLYVRGPGMVYIPDSNLQAAIRTAIAKPTGDIMESDLANITMLDIKSKGIVSLEGLQFAKKLRTLYLTDNKIEDISQLKYLTDLSDLYLNFNKIKNISPLSSLTNLTSISMGDNSVTDLSPLSNLTNLNYLDVTRNKISDISSLQKLKNLVRLSLNDCGISDISVVAGFTKLTSFSIDNNYVSDISPLYGLTCLTDLCLSNNLIEDFTSLTNLANLTRINLSGNNIRDYSNYNLFNDNIKIDFWGLEQSKSEVAAIMGKADEIIASVTTPDMTQVQKEKALHDYICNNTVYTLGINKGAYGILILGKGSCAAYADTMNLLLNRIGIYCIKIRGYAGSEAHAWNIVMIDGKYYQLDVTWDTCYTNEDGILCTKYFNVNDEFMLKERTWDRSKYPACN